MFGVFLFRAYVLHAILIAVVITLFFVTASQNVAHPNGPLVFVASTLTLVAWYFSDFLVTGSCGSNRMFHGSDGAVICGTFLFAGFSALCATGGPVNGATFLFCLLNLGLWTLSLVLCNGYELFRRHMAPLLHETRAEYEHEQRQMKMEENRCRQRLGERHRQHQKHQDQLAAKKLVIEFYETHQEILEEKFPLARFRATLRAAIPPGMEPNVAWSAAKKLIDELQPLVTEGLVSRRLASEKQQQREDSQRQLDAQVSALSKKLADLQDRTDDESVEEAMAIRRQIGNLHKSSQRQTISPSNL